MRHFSNQYSLVSIAALTLGLLGLSVGCQEEPAPHETTSATGMALSADLTGESDVATMRFEVTPVDCSSGEPTGDPVVTEVPFEDFTIPGGISELENKPLDAESSHVFADLFSDVPPGCYDIVATPLGEDGLPSGICAAAHEDGVEVVEGETTEVLLINQCAGSDSSAIDTIATLNHEPEVTVEFEDSKFVCSGSPQVICASAVDPDEDPLEFVWSVSGGDAITGPTVVSRDFDPTTNTQTECVEVRASEPGRYDVNVAVYDLVWRDGEPVRIEDWLATEGYPSESHGELSFFFYAAECKASLEGVGMVEGDYAYSVVMDVSDDGSTATGYTGGSSTTEAFQWNGSLAPIGVPAGFSYSYGFGVSGDGSVVAGYGADATGTYALLWSGGTWTNLGLLPGGHYTVGYDVSADGKVVVGYGDDSTGTTLPFRWESGTGLVALAPPAGYYGSLIFSTSADASVSAGYGWSSSGSRAIVWDSSGATALPSPSDAYAFAISGDGKVVGGYMYTGSTYRPVLWSGGGSAVDLGDVPGGSDYGYVWGLNADGSVGVGYADNGTAQTGMIWDAAHGMRSLYQVLADAGVDVSDWNLYMVYGVSADGNVVGGYGWRTSTGRTEGFVAHLP